MYDTNDSEAKNTKDLFFGNYNTGNRSVEYKGMVNKKYD